MLINLDESIELLKSGHVVAIPTETVYGLAASITSPKAIEQVFQLKKRPADNPLIVHIATNEQLRDLITEMPEGSEELMRAFWPGALTLIFPANMTRIPAIVRAGLPTIGIRMPRHSLTLELIKATDPLVAPSANLSGRPSSTCPEHVIEDFGENLPILAGGVCSQGVESTIVTVKEGRWKIVRLGAVSAEALQRVLGYEVWNFQDDTAVFDKDKPLCPGQKYRHYAPSARLILDSMPYAGSPKIVVGFDGRDYPGAEKIFRLGNVNSPNSVESNLYAVLRSLDTEGIKEAWVDINFDHHGPLRTIYERLKKAAS